MNTNRFALLLGVFAVSASCSFLPPETGNTTFIDIQIDPASIKGTQAHLALFPEDDRVYYMADVLSEAEYNEGIRIYGSEEAAANAGLKEMYDIYALYSKEMYGDQAYIASFKNSNLIYGNASQLLVGLTPETDYYAVAYCVDCVNDSTFRINGELFKKKFRTTEVQWDLSKMQLEYMVRDYDGKLYCYTKPTYFDYDLQHNGKICRDPYIVDMIPEKELNEVYGGDVFAFAFAYYTMISESGFLSEYLNTDISRKEYHLTPDDEDEWFYIVGAPLNITNLELLYILKFQYKRNMSTKYSSEAISIAQ